MNTILRRFGSLFGVVLFALLTNQASAQTPLTNAAPLTNLSGAQGSQAFYKITVPAAQGKLEVKITGSVGDCDLYVKLGAAPTTSSYDYRPLYQQQ